MTYIFYKLEEKIFEYCDKKLSITLQRPYKMRYLKCNKYENCINPVFKNYNECALHCLDREVKEKDTSEYLKCFSSLFMEYLFKKIINNKFYMVNKDGVAIRNYSISSFQHRNIIFNNELKKRVGEISIVVENIIFPKNIKLEDFILNARTIIRYLGKVTFENCQFSSLYFNGG